MQRTRYEPSAPCLRNRAGLPAAGRSSFVWYYNPGTAAREFRIASNVERIFSFESTRIVLKVSRNLVSQHLSLTPLQPTG